MNYASGHPCSMLSCCLKWHLDDFKEKSIGYSSACSSQHQSKSDRVSKAHVGCKWLPKELNTVAGTAFISETMARSSKTVAACLYRSNLTTASTRTAKHPAGNCLVDHRRTIKITGRDARPGWCHWSSPAHLSIFSRLWARWSSSEIDRYSVESAIRGLDPAKDVSLSDQSGTSGTNAYSWTWTRETQVRESSLQ